MSDTPTTQPQHRPYCDLNVHKDRPIGCNCDFGSDSSTPALDAFIGGLEVNIPLAEKDGNDGTLRLLKMLAEAVRKDLRNGR